MGDAAILAPIIAGSSLLLNIANFFYTNRQIKSTRKMDRIFFALDEFRKVTQNFANEVELNITWDQARKRVPEIFRIERNARKVLDQCEHLLPKTQYEELYCAHRTWSSELMAEGFPVQRKANAMTSSSAEYKSINTAQGNLEKTINHVIAILCGEARAIAPRK